MCLDASMCIDWSVVANIAVAICTGILALFTYRLALATVSMAEESKNGSVRQIGVQTWLALEARFDSYEIKLYRQRLAMQMPLYNTPYPTMATKHDEIDDSVFELFESIGKLYNEDLINRNLAESSFGFHAAGWWQIAEKYIQEERKKHGNDDEIYIEFQKFAVGMIKLNKDIDLQKFLNDEKKLRVHQEPEVL